MVVGPAGDDEVVCTRQRRHLVPLLGGVAPVDRFGPGHAELGQFRDGPLELGGFQPQAQGVGEHGDGS